MIINLVVAASDNNVIGKDNKLLWRLPKDLAFFKNTTWAMPVIMGRKTFESMGTPLKGRTNIIITRKQGSPELSGNNDIILVTSVQEAIKASQETDAKECYVIGGGEIYNLTLPIANRIYMTRVHAQLEGDTFFPPIDEKAWQLTGSTSFEADEKHAYPYTFEIWQRK
jgi:dihydrofolate reductase